MRPTGPNRVMPLIRCEIGDEAAREVTVEAVDEIPPDHSEKRSI